MRKQSGTVNDAIRFSIPILVLPSPVFLRIVTKLLTVLMMGLLAPDYIKACLHVACASASTFRRLPHVLY